MSARDVEPLPRWFTAEKPAGQYSRRHHTSAKAGRALAGQGKDAETTTPPPSASNDEGRGHDQKERT